MFVNSLNDIEPIARRLYPRKLQWDTGVTDESVDISIGSSFNADSVGLVPDWVPLKSKLEKCTMDKFLLYWFDNQTEMSWARIKKDKEQYAHYDASKDKYFVCRAKKLVKNMFLYGNENGLNCNIKDRPRNVDCLSLWRQELALLSSTVHSMLFEELKNEGMLKKDKNVSEIRFQLYHVAVNKLMDKKYRNDKCN